MHIFSDLNATMNFNRNMTAINFNNGSNIDIALLDTLNKFFQIRGCNNTDHLLIVILGSYYLGLIIQNYI